MMKKSRLTRLFSLFAALMVVVSLMVPASAAEVPGSGAGTAANSGIMPMASSHLWDKPLSGDSMSLPFTTSSAYPYFKVWIDNNGTASIIVTITKDSPTGTVVSGTQKTIRAGSSPVSIKPYSASQSTGTYYINLTCSGGEMAGTAAVRIASTYSELGD